ncbi:MAG: DoxX family protein [Candidatus Ryanbacteria bacterium]|nr:DoxX family protein [Candidatus Ryanbacteria bacterium]
MSFLDRIADKYQFIAPYILRFGLAVVFLLFGINKLRLQGSQGTAEIQLLFDLGLGTAAAINYYVSLLEIAIGIFLLTGWKVRLAGLIAGAMTFFIFTSYFVQKGFSINPDLYRDLGLTAAGLAIFLIGKSKKEPATPQQ